MKGGRACRATLTTCLCVGKRRRTPPPRLAPNSGSPQVEAVIAARRAATRLDENTAEHRSLMQASNGLEDNGQPKQVVRQILGGIRETRTTIGDETTIVHEQIGAKAGAFAMLVPKTDTQATQLEVIDRNGGTQLVEGLRRMAGIREQLPTQFEHFNKLSNNLIATIEKDFICVCAKARDQGCDMPMSNGHPKDWEESTELLQRILLAATQYKPMDPPPPPHLPPIEHGGTKMPIGSVLELKRASKEGLDGAVNPSAIKSLGTSTVIMANHLNNRMLEELPKKDRPTSVQLMRTYAEHPDLGGQYRAVMVSNKQVNGDLPGKGEITAYPIIICNEVGEDIVRFVEHVLGKALSHKHRSKVSSWVAKARTGQFDFSTTVELLGCTTCYDEDMDAEGTLGKTKGGTAPADIERAMGRLACVLRMYFVNGLGVDEIRPDFDLVILAQTCKDLSEINRIELFEHVMAGFARMVEYMRRDAEHPIADFHAVVDRARLFKLSRLRAKEEAEKCGREAGREAANQAVGNKRPNDNGGGSGSDPTKAAKKEPRQQAKHDFSYAPNSLTQMLGQGKPVGVIEAFDALNAKGNPCAWRALCKDGCKKQNCRKCKDDKTPEAPQWAIDKVKAACNASVLTQLK